MELDNLLLEIAKHGSVRKAAKSLSVSAESISKRFRHLDDSNPLKQKYIELIGKKGRPRKYVNTIEGTRSRVKNAVKAHRLRRKTF